MAFLSSINIIGSGLTAQQLRLDVVSENITNSTTTRTENDGGAYRRKMVVFEAQSGREDFRSAMAKAAGKAKDAPFTIAADVPSGVSAQTGDAALPRIYADETVTMIVYKPGLLARKAAPMTGAVRLAPLVDDVEHYLDAMK